MWKNKDLISVLLLAAAVRLGVMILLPSLYHADENFQSLEQAHRLAFGYGIQPWEMSDGLRSMLLPYLFSRIFILSDQLFHDRLIYIPITRALLVILSLAGVAAVFQMGLRRSRTHALLAGLVAATWFELVYFSARPLTEAIATNFLLISLCLTTPTESSISGKRMFAIGFCLSLCLMLRIHLAPGLLVIAYYAGSRDSWSRAHFLVAGGLIPLIAFGTADYLAWGSPFHSYFAAIHVNILENKASHYGVASAFWYIQRFFQLWAGAIPLLMLLIGLRWRESRPWILTALAILVVHSLISHKEDRFVYPAHACLVIVAALASADLVLEWSKRLGMPDPRSLTIVVAVLWFLTSISLAIAPGFLDNWRNGRQLIQGFALLHDRADLCGLALTDHIWWETGGYAHLHRNIPIYDLANDVKTFSGTTSAYNYVLLDRASITKLPQEYQPQQCFGSKDKDVCVASRAGPCSTVEDLHPLLDHRRLGE